MQEKGVLQAVTLDRPRKVTRCLRWAEEQVTLGFLELKGEHLREEPKVGQDNNGMSHREAKHQLHALVVVSVGKQIMLTRIAD